MVKLIADPLPFRPYHLSLRDPFQLTYSFDADHIDFEWWAFGILEGGTYEGSFTYELDAEGVPTSVEGLVNSYYYGSGNEFGYQHVTISDFSLDINLFLDPHENVFEIIFAGADLLIGSTGAGEYHGYAGNDTIYGGSNDSGERLMDGGDGSDTATYVSSFTAVTASLADQAVNTGTAKDDRYISIENLTGSAFADILYGESGENILDGGAGADVMRGGAGVDRYIVDNVGDIVDESTAGANGEDIVLSSITFSLLDTVHVKGSVEIVQLLGTANIDATGNALTNRLIGNSGANTVDGGIGADWMQGRGGNDTYIVDNVGDLVDEALGGSSGIDLVRSAVSFSLVDATQAKGAIENLTLLGSANINAIGNALNNILTGNSGANTLNGLGGADTMAGGQGNDRYAVDNTGDVVDEGIAGSNGIDLVLSTVSFSLVDAAHAKGSIENLTLVGTLNLNALGNSLGNVLVGNAGANTLNGGGGADILRGGAGNDIYTVDNAADVVDESVAGSSGVDIVHSTVSFDLASSTQTRGVLENVTLLGTIEANAFGNSLNNVLTGNAGANILGGGVGNDSLTGAGGNDIFLFNTSPNAATNRDIITDMNLAGNDTIGLENAIFTALTAGALASGAFRIGAAAADADDRILYNRANGELTYDSNGSAAGGSTIFATLSPGLALTASDFFVV